MSKAQDTGMTYSESAEGVQISRQRALKEIADHGLTGADDLDDFYDVCGDQESYDAGDVLRWLGY